MLKARVVTKGGTQKLDKVSPGLVARIQKGVRALIIKMQSTIQTSKLSGQVLNRRSGKLSDSLHHEDRIEKGAIVGEVYTGKEAPYAKVHEWGGTFTIRQHTRQTTMGETIVREHQATFPERSFMRSTHLEFRSPFKQMIERAVMEQAKAGATT